MSDARNQPLLEALLDSWDRNNAIMLGLLRAIPEGGTCGGASGAAGEATRGAGRDSTARYFFLGALKTVITTPATPSTARTTPGTNPRGTKESSTSVAVAGTMTPR